MTISATVIRDSINPCGNRLTTVQVRLPKCLLAEINTHRVFSRSFNSSRAIPASTMRSSATFEPIEWGSNRSGMTAAAELTGWRLQIAKLIWRSSQELAVTHHKALEWVGLHKQHTNRVIEPYLWADGTITATDWYNFFELRCHPDAQPEIRLLATLIRDAILASSPDSLEHKEWHLPYITDADIEYIARSNSFPEKEARAIDYLKNISASRCARVSYGFDKPFDIDKDLSRSIKLLDANPKHYSPFEHVAQALDRPTRIANFTGWHQYRKQLESIANN